MLEDHDDVKENYSSAIFYRKKRKWNEENKIQETEKKSNGKRKPFYICGVKGCGKIVNSPWELNKHESSHFDREQYRCTFPGCNRTGFQYFKIASHFRTHPVEKPNVCYRLGCGYTSMSAHRLQTHQRRCHIHPRICCKLCMNTPFFETEEQLYQHRQRNHTKKELYYNITEKVTKLSKEEIRKVKEMIEEIDTLSKHISKAHSETYFYYPLANQTLRYFTNLPTLTAENQQRVHIDTLVSSFKVPDFQTYPSRPHPDLFVLQNKKATLQQSPFRERQQKWLETILT